MSYGYIYLIKDHFTKKVYVGKTTNQSLKGIKNYFGSGKIIRQVIQKRGSIHLEKIILGWCNSEKLLNKAEKECIKFFQSNNRLYGYNILEGGQGGFIHTIPGNRKGCSPWNKGAKNSQKAWNKKEIDFEKLKRLFESNINTEELAKEFNCSVVHITRCLKKLNLTYSSEKAKQIRAELYKKIKLYDYDKRGWISRASENLKISRTQIIRIKKEFEENNNEKTN